MEQQKIKEIYTLANLAEDELLKEINREANEDRLKTMRAIKRRLVNIQLECQDVYSLLETLR